MQDPAQKRFIFAPIKSIREQQKIHEQSNDYDTDKAFVFQRLAIREPNGRHDFKETSILWASFDNLHANHSARSGTIFGF